MQLACKLISAKCDLRYRNPFAKGANNIYDDKIVEILDELKRDLKNYELEKRIEELESKFSQDFSENTFKELKELKKLQKIN